ncbi:hypothetical protein COOONC_24371 [Cooperia oncophora]
MGRRPFESSLRRPTKLSLFLWRNFNNPSLPLENKLRVTLNAGTRSEKEKVERMEIGAHYGCSGLLSEDKLNLQSSVPLPALSRTWNSCTFTGLLIGFHVCML